MVASSTSPPGRAWRASPGNTPYNATKEAIRALTRTAAREWGKYGISVNTVNPSLRTDAWENWEANNTEFVQGLKDKMPLGFLGDPRSTVLRGSCGWPERAASTSPA